MWDEPSERALDEAIDRAARELTAGMPDASIKARVLARIETGAPASARHFPWTAPMAVAALLLLAVVVWRRGEVVRTPPPPASASVSTATQQPATVAPERNAGAVDVDAGPRAPRTSRVLSTPQTSRPAGTPRPSVVAALAPPRLTVEPLGVEPVEKMRSIQLSEMTVPTIELAPLSNDDKEK